MDFSKVFNHEFLVAKINAYGFSKYIIRLIFSYLNNRTQRVKVNKIFSSWRELLYGLPNGFLLEPIFFKYIFKRFIFK